MGITGGSDHSCDPVSYSRREFLAQPTHKALLIGMIVTPAVGAGNTQSLLRCTLRTRAQSRMRISGSSSCRRINVAYAQDSYLFYQLVIAIGYARHRVVAFKFDLLPTCLPCLPEGVSSSASCKRAASAWHDQRTHPLCLIFIKRP